MQLNYSNSVVSAALPPPFAAAALYRCSATVEWVLKTDVMLRRLAVQARSRVDSDPCAVT
jgi:hypothetical protein